MHQPSRLYKRHRFPGELISHAAWLYYRFLLSYRHVEELLAERGIVVSYETIRRWCHNFGQTYADGLRRRRARPGDKWHIDEVQLKINGRKHWLWRAVDQDGVVLDILVQARRDQQEADPQAKTVATWGILSYCSRMALRRRLAASPASQSLSEPSMAPKHEDDRTDDLKGNHQQ